VRFVWGISQAAASSSVTWDPENPSDILLDKPPVSRWGGRCTYVDDPVVVDPVCFV
jgi:hypothetical protein